MPAARRLSAEQMRHDAQDQGGRKNRQVFHLRIKSPDDRGCKEKCLIGVKFGPEKRLANLGAGRKLKIKTKPHAGRRQETKWEI